MRIFWCFFQDAGYKAYIYVCVYVCTNLDSLKGHRFQQLLAGHFFPIAEQGMLPLADSVSEDAASRRMSADLSQSCLLD